MKHRVWPKLIELAEQIERTDLAGLSRASLARQLGMSAASLSVISRLMDLPAPPSLEARDGKNDWNAIFAEHGGEEASTIAKIVGCDPAIVRRAAKRRGIELHQSDYAKRCVEVWERRKGATV